MSQVKIFSTDKLNKKNFLTYIGSLGASFRATKLSDPSFDLAFDITSQSELHRQHLIVEACRKLDTLNIKYEVIK